MPPKKKQKGGDVVWEWQNDAGAYVPFAEEDCSLLESFYGMGNSIETYAFSFNKEFQTLYKVDYVAMLQVNLETNMQRKIRRIERSSEKAVPSPASPPGSPGKRKDVLFEWFTDDLTWAPFDPKDCALLESAYHSGKAKLFSTKDLTFNVGFDSLYIFDFHLMTQMNMDSGTSRKIRRIGTTGIVAGVGGDDDDAAVSFASAATPSATSSPPAAAAKPPKPKPAPAKSAATAMPDPLSPAEVKAQASLGAQSKRGVKAIDYGPVVSGDAHGSHCFDRMLENEARLCGEWAVFYHSYSVAALLYEVQAAVAAVLFRFKSTFAVLPRLLLKGFAAYPDAPALLAAFPTMVGQDHDPRYRQVGVCGTSALLADDSEAPAKSVFLMGYSVGPLKGVLENLLVACGFPKAKVKDLAKQIVSLSTKHGLDVRGFGGKGCKSGRSGHLLQIFVKRELVDKYVYASLPYGVPDPPRQPLSKFLAGPGPIHGQVRICAHPAVFMRAAYVRMYVYSADPTFHAKRQAFQEELTNLLDPILGSAEARREAAEGIFDGEVPAWFT
eukprot:EG_transcript_8141